MKWIPVITLTLLLLSCSHIPHRDGGAILTPLTISAATERIIATVIQCFPAEVETDEVHDGYTVSSFLVKVKTMSGEKSFRVLVVAREGGSIIAVRSLSGEDDSSLRTFIEKAVAGSPLCRF
jgi:hypothetical protein